MSQHNTYSVLTPANPREQAYRAREYARYLMGDPAADRLDAALPLTAVVVYGKPDRSAEATAGPVGQDRGPRPYLLDGPPVPMSRMRRLPARPVGARNDC